MGLFTEFRARARVYGKAGRWIAIATWSRETRARLQRLVPVLEALPAPMLVTIAHLDQYDYSFSMPRALRLRSSERSDLVFIARSLFAMPTPRRLVLLEDLLFDRFDGACLHTLFALSRDALGALAADPRCALHAAPSVTGPRVGGFPLHSDLYVPEILFNVFDNVARDASGTAIFVPVSILRAALRTLPREIASEILACYAPGQHTDRFERAYSLLHRKRSMRGWCDQNLLPHAIRVEPRRGGGYLLHDRTWMHGREAPSNGVPINRLHRLVFNNARLTRARAR